MSIEQLEEMLSPWEATVEETDTGLFRILLSHDGDLDAAFDGLPHEDVFVETAFLGQGVSDLGLRSFLAHERKRLRFLTIRSPNVSGQSLRELSKVPLVERLLIEFQGDPENACRGISHCTSVQTLSVVCPLDPLEESLEHLETLNELVECELTAKHLGPRLESIAKLKALRILSLESESIEGHQVGALTPATNLEYLSLSGKGITEKTLFALPSLKELQSLRIVGGRIRGSGFKGLENLKALAELRLEDTVLEEDAIATLETTGVRVLHISSKLPIDNRFLEYLSRCTFLKRLYMYAPLTKAQQLRLQKALPEQY